jgi:uncharacterized membrane protein YvbJ
MALMICPDCGKEISDAAISCPNCGLPRPAYERQSRDRRRAEAEAHEGHRQSVRNLYIAAGVFAIGALGLFVAVILSPWSRAALTSKAEELVIAAVLGAIGYGLYRQAERKSPPSHT